MFDRVRHFCVSCFFLFLSFFSHVQFYSRLFHSMGNASSLLYCERVRVFFFFLLLDLLVCSTIIVLPLASAERRRTATHIHNDYVCVCVCFWNTYRAHVRVGI